MGISRREFGIGLIRSAGALFLASQLKKIGMRDISPELLEVVENEKKLETIIEGLSLYLQIESVSRLKHEGITLPENPSYKNITLIIDDAIEQFGDPVFYEKNGGFTTDEEFFEKIGDDVKGLTIPTAVGVLKGDERSIQKLGKMKTDITSSENLTAAMGLSQGNFVSIENCVAHAMSLRSGATSNVHASENIPDIIPFYQENRSPEVDTYILECYSSIVSRVNSIKTKIDSLSETEKPVSSSFVLTEYLRLNNGNIRASIADMTIFFKITSRNIFKNNEIQYIHDADDPQKEIDAICSWYEKSIKDEYSVLGDQFNIPYSKQKELGNDPLDKDLSPINLIGNPYHIWNIVALLSQCEPKTISFAVLGTQIFELHSSKNEGPQKNQGNLKTINDLNALLQLKEISELLNSKIK